MTNKKSNRNNAKPRDLSEVSLLSYVEFEGKKVNIEDIAQKIKSLYSQKYHKKLLKLEIYINTAESRAYYVANGIAGPDSYIEL